MKETNKNIATLKGNVTKAKKTGDPEKIAAAEAALAEALKAEPVQESEKVDDPEKQPEGDSKKVVLNENGPEHYELIADGRTVKYQLREKAPYLKDEEYTGFKAETKSTVEAIAEAYNAVYASGDLDLATKLATHADKLCKCYNAASLKESFVLAKNAGDPMIDAVTRHLYETISATPRKKADEAYFTISVAEKSRRIPLDKLYRELEGIGADKHWIYTAQAVNKLFTARAISSKNPGKSMADIYRDLGGYTMDDAAKKLEAGENPVSNNKLLAALRRVISEMIGEENGKKVIGIDVRHVLDLYLKEDRNDAHGTTLEAATHKKFYDLLSIVCYRVLTGGTYKITYKVK